MNLSTHLIKSLKKLYISQEKLYQIVKDYAIISIRSDESTLIYGSILLRSRCLIHVSIAIPIREINETTLSENDIELVEFIRKFVAIKMLKDLRIVYYVEDDKFKDYPLSEESSASHFGWNLFSYFNTSKDTLISNVKAECNNLGFNITFSIKHNIIKSRTSSLLGLTTKNESNTSILPKCLKLYSDDKLCESHSSNFCKALKYARLLYKKDYMYLIQQSNPLDPYSNVLKLVNLYLLHTTFRKVLILDREFKEFIKLFTSYFGKLSESELDVKLDEIYNLYLLRDVEDIAGRWKEMREESYNVIKGQVVDMSTSQQMFNFMMTDKCLECCMVLCAALINEDTCENRTTTCLAVCLMKYLIKTTESFITSLNRNERNSKKKNRNSSLIHDRVLDIVFKNKELDNHWFGCLSTEIGVISSVTETPIENISNIANSLLQLSKSRQ